MQRFTNRFVSRCSPFPYCESDSVLVSSPVGAFFIGLGKHLCCFPKSCSNACSSPSFKVVTGYPLTGHPRVFRCQGTWAKLPGGRKKGMTTAWEAVCHALTRWSSFSPAKLVDAGSYPASYTGIDPACPAVELCTKRVNRKYEVVITNDLESLFVYREYTISRTRCQYLIRKYF